MDEINEFNALIQAQQSGFKEGSSLQSFNFATYNVPIFKEKLYKKWVNAGQDNLWPNYLVDKMNKCAIHNAILESKVKQIIGEGLQVEDSQDKDQLAQVHQFLKKINIKKLIRRIAFDYELFGYFFIGITWSNDRTKIANIYHVDASTIRCGVPNKETREIENFWYSEDWTQFKKKDFEPEEIPVFDPSNRIEPNCLLMVRGYRPNTRFYNLPTYVGALNAIELNYEIGSYMLNSIKNGLSPSMNISFNNGNPSDEEKEVVYKSIRNLYSGSNNAGKFILSFNQSKDNATTVEPIETGNMSEIYSKLSEFCQNEIVRGHRLPNPVLAGISVPGQLGLTNELVQASELFYNQVIAPVQLLIEETIHDLLEINGFTLRTFIKDSNPISFTYQDSSLMNILTINELRQRIGMPPLSEKDKENLPALMKGGSAGQKQPMMPVKPKTAGMSNEDEDEDDVKTNDILRNLTGRQYQGLMRIMKQVSNGKLTKQQGGIMMKSAYGLDDEQVEVFLRDEDEEMSLIPGTPYINQTPDNKKKLIK